MGRPRKEVNDLKINWTIKQKREIVDKFKKIKNYNLVIENLLKKYLEENKNHR